MPPRPEPAASPPRGRLRGALLFGGLLAASILFRLPPLLNARGVHSDSAIVGLQARHMLRGEWSWLLWGDGQQSSFDALMVALGFAVAGDGALTLMAVPLAGHLLMTWFVWDLLRRRVGEASATIAALVLVVGPPPITIIALYAPRQWCFTAAGAGFWLLDGAGRSRWPLARYALGVGVGLASASLDLIALAFLPALLAFAAACALDGGPGPATVRRRLLAIAIGLAAVSPLVWLPRRDVGSSARKAGVSIARVPENARLLGETCLPWTLSARAFVPGEDPRVLSAWEPGPAFRAVQAAGAGSMALGLLSGAIFAFARRVPWEVRRTGLLGSAVAGGALAGYLVSVMPVDAWSIRYLGPVVWSAPLAIAPAAWLLGARRLGWAMAPYLAAAAVNGWLGYGPYVRGPRPVLTARGVAEDEARLGEELARRGVRHATADYWLAYRLTFLLREELVVTPISGTDVRYGPYNQAFASAPVVAYLFRPSAPGGSADSYEADLRASGTPVERLDVAGFRVLLLNSVSFPYDDDRGEGRLTFLDLGPSGDPDARRIRATLVQGGVRSEGMGLRRTLERHRPFTTSWEFTLDGPRGRLAYRGRTTSASVPCGGGTYSRIDEPRMQGSWRIGPMDRK